MLRKLTILGINTCSTGTNHIDMEYCKECFTPSTRPRIRFSQGICNACEYKRVKDNDIDWEEREFELKQLCDKYRSRNNSYFFCTLFCSRFSIGIIGF